MRLLVRSFVAAAFAVGTFFVLAPTNAQAGFILGLSTGASSAQVNGAGGVATFSGALGNFTVNVTTGLSKGAIGNANLATIDLNSVNVTSGSAGGTLTIVLADTDFTLPAASAYTMQSSVGGTVSAPGSNSLTFQSWANNSNASPFDSGFPPFTVPAGSISTGPQGSFSGGGAFSSDVSNIVSVNNAGFSLFTEAVITLAPNSSVSFDGFESVSAVPEPATMTLAIMGIPFVALGYWRTRRSQKNV